MNPKEMRLLFAIADRLDNLEKQIKEKESRLAALETRIKKFEAFFFREKEEIGE